MGSAGDIPGDLRVIGLVGQNEAAGGVAFQQSRKNRGIGRVTADNAMRTELENIADPGDRSCGVWLERPLLQPLSGVTENDVIDFGRREPSDLYRRVEQDQFLKLDLQRLEIPLPLFRQAIDRQSRVRAVRRGSNARRAHMGLDQGPIASPPRIALRRQ